MSVTKRSDRKRSLFLAILTLLITIGKLTVDIDVTILKAILVFQFSDTLEERPLAPIRPGYKAAILPWGTKKASIARLSVVKQSSFGLPGKYGRRVTRVNRPNTR